MYLLKPSSLIILATRPGDLYVIMPLAMTLPFVD
jgi:hypothetical protein